MFFFKLSKSKFEFYGGIGIVIKAGIRIIAMWVELESKMLVDMDSTPRSARPIGDYGQPNETRKNPTKSQVFKIHLFDFQYIRSALSVLVPSELWWLQPSHNCRGTAVM